MNFLLRFRSQFLIHVLWIKIEELLRVESNYGDRPVLLLGAAKCETRTHGRIVCRTVFLFLKRTRFSSATQVKHSAESALRPALFCGLWDIFFE